MGPEIWISELNFENESIGILIIPSSRGVSMNSVFYTMRGLIFRECILLCISSIY
jgi:hypothetical protein